MDARSAIPRRWLDRADGKRGATGDLVAGRMTSKLTLERVQDIVTLVAGPDRSPSGAGPDTPLKDGGFWLDSAGLLEVIIACEVEFDVVFDPETDFTDQALGTVRTLFDLIQARRAG